MDTTALESAITLLRQTHTLAVSACPTVPSWRPKVAKRLRGRGADWIE